MNDSQGVALGRIEEKVDAVIKILGGEGPHNIGLVARVDALKAHQDMVIGGFTGLSILGAILGWLHANFWPFGTGTGH